VQIGMTVMLPQIGVDGMTSDVTVMTVPGVGAWGHFICVTHSMSRTLQVCELIFQPVAAQDQISIRST